MGWVQDMTARWTTILTAGGDDGTPLDEAVRQLNATFEPPAKSSRPRRLRDQQLRALQTELSGSCALLRSPERASYVGLGERIEHLLALAEAQASEPIDAARTEAAAITAAATAPTPAGHDPHPVPADDPSDA